MTKNCSIRKKGFCEFLNPQTTDHQSGMLTIIPNEQAASEDTEKLSLSHSHG